MPERISHAPPRSFGRISISKSLYKFAVITSLFCAGFHLCTSHNSKLAPRILFNRAFDLATEIAAGSLSIPTTRPAPKHFAAKARIPLPVPRSTSDQPGFQRRVTFSKKRSDIAVVACSPVPNANEAGITRHAGLMVWAVGCAVLSVSGLAWWRELRWGQRTLQRRSSFMDLTITNRFPILIG